jgi:hypothetical protein
MIDYHVFDDDEDLEEGYDDDQEDNFDLLKKLEAEIKTGSEKRAESLVAGEAHEELVSLIDVLKKL